MAGPFVFGDYVVYKPTANRLMRQPVRFALVWHGWRLRPTDDIVAPKAEDPETQREKFEEAAHELGTDDDPSRFDERMAKLVKQKPAEKLE